MHTQEEVAIKSEWELTFHYINGRDQEKAIHKGEHTLIKQIHGKTFNLTSSQTNANKNYSEISFTIIKILKDLFQVIIASVLNGEIKWLSHTLLLGENEIE